MRRVRKVFYNEENENSADESLRLTMLLHQLLSLYHYRTVKTELAWLKQQREKVKMAQQLDALNRHSQHISQFNREYFSAMNDKNTQRVLSLMDMRKWLEKEQGMVQQQQDAILRIKQQETDYLRQCDKVAAHFQLVVGKRKRQEKFRFILEYLHAI
ncbi:hypothetical protein C813_15720 [Kosakonia sacchari SP1]|uniref:Uncharacterized protein n=1 Tax=Kosakonia sacchari TaxID=1158459 RepID=A0A1G4YCN0_9ENTR|nr:hypothetical protein C813_15720 [Kosakonia sacchari SP1]SCX51271.1 hypothetical protein SAMN02927897_02427 [Kosakonia sacchari]